MTSVKQILFKIFYQLVFSYRGSRASGDPVFEAARSAALPKQNLASGVHNIQ
jgi:hypothetical protein